MDFNGRRLDLPKQLTVQFNYKQNRTNSMKSEDIILVCIE